MIYSGKCAVNERLVTMEVKITPPITTTTKQTVVLKFTDAEVESAMIDYALKHQEHLKEEPIPTGEYEVTYPQNDRHMSQRQGPFHLTLELKNP